MLLPPFLHKPKSVLSTLNSIFNNYLGILMSEFLQSIIDRDPAAKSKLSLILTYPGVKAVFFHRLAHFFFSS